MSPNLIELVRRRSVGAACREIRRRAASIGLAVAVVALSAPLARTQAQQSADSKSGTEQPDRDSQSIEIRDLADGDYADRQRATREMWRMHDRTRQAVQDAARDADPEVAERAGWILKQWRSGALPGVGEIESGLLLDRDSTSALAAVLEQGMFSAVLVAVEESAGTIEFDQIKQRVARSLRERFPIYIDKAFAAGTLDDLIALIDAVAIDRSFAASARDLNRVLQLETDEADPLPGAASVWDDFEKRICLSMFATLAGKSDSAIELAGQASDPDALRIARILGGDWQVIATESISAAEQAPEEAEQVAMASWALAAASRCGDDAIRGRAKKILRKVSEGESDDVSATRWRCLAMHDDVDAAIDVLQQFDEPFAATLASASSRFERAAELCRADLDEIESELDAFIDRAIAEQIKLPAGQLAPAVERLYPLARLLAMTGNDDHAYRIYQRLTSKETLISEYGESLRERTLIELDLVNRHDWLIEFAVGRGENVASQRTRIIAAIAFGTELASFTRVLVQLKIVQPRSTFQDRFRTACQLFRGKSPERFEPQDFEALFESLLRHREVKRVAGRVMQVESVALDGEIIDMFLKQGQIDLAHRGLEILSRKQDIDAMISLAQHQTEHGDHAAAAELWNRVAVRSAEYSATNSIITLDHGLAYAKSVVGRWVLAKRSGHRRNAEQLEQRLRLMLASPSLTFRKGLAEFLRTSRQYRLAAETYRELAILSAYGGSEAPDFFRVSVAYVGVLDNLQESDPDAFAELGLTGESKVTWSDLAIVGLLMTTLYDETGFVTIPLSVRKTFLQQAIDEKDADLAKRAIDQIKMYDPLNIDVGERMLPELREAGLGEIADEALDELFDRGLAHLERFGTDTTALNNFAWAAAMNRQRLDEALQMSERAVMFEPDSVVFRDTLAEVLHLLGRTREAFQIESACLLDEPDEWHLHEQVAKYRELLEDQRPE